MGVGRSPVGPRGPEVQRRRDMNTPRKSQRRGRTPTLSATTLITIMFVVVLWAASLVSGPGGVESRAGTPTPPFHRDADGFPDRVEFARQFAHFRNGMPEGQVLAHLGKPDDIVRAVGTDSQDWDVAWCYGANGHLTFPTLG